MVNFFAKIIANGSEVSGESRETGFSGQVEVVAYKWGGQRAQAHQGGGGRQGRPTLRELIIRKRVDSATPLLFKAFTENAVCSVNLSLRKSGGELEKYFEIELKDAIVSEINQGNLDFGGETPEEEVYFSYRSIRMIYDVQDDATGITRGGIEHEYAHMSAS